MSSRCSSSHSPVYDLPKVETVYHYYRDSDFSIWPGKLSSRLSSAGEIALAQPSKSSLINAELNTKHYHDEKKVEQNMQSFLIFIKGKPDVLHNKEFVEFRQILATVAAATSKVNRIQSFRWNGIIWSVWFDEDEPAAAGSLEEQKQARGFAFCQSCINRKEGNGDFQKAVNHLSFPVPGEADANILLSAEIDGIRQNGEHVEMKSTMLTKPEWLQIRSCYCFWQNYFGNTYKTILGRIKQSTTVNEKGDIEKKEYIRKLFSFTQEGLLKDLQGHWFEWSVEEGKRKVGELLKARRRLLKNDGDAVVFKQQWEDDHYEWIEDTTVRVDQEFINLVKIATDSSRHRG